MLEWWTALRCAREASVARPPPPGGRYLSPHPNPTIPPEPQIPSLTARALLFDLDGVLVDSRRAVEAVWRKWARARSLDPDPFLAVAPGRRTSDSLRLVAPHLDVPREVAALDAMEEVEVDGLEAVPGAPGLLAELAAHEWAIVTSGSVGVASLRLAAVGLPRPHVFITSEQVDHGKPSPQGYLLAAAMLGRAPQDCLVIEDAPPGILAARAAHMPVLALATTHAQTDLGDADLVAPTLAGLTLSRPRAGVLVLKR